MDITALSASSAQQPQAFSQLTENFDTFLTLLTTQLRNQDPLSPLDTEKFTEQLVQFASVEQSIQTNQHLEALLALQTASSNETALSMVDRTASVNSNIAALGDDGANWRYELSEDAAEIAINVLDQSGAVVATLAGPASAGIHDLKWLGDTNTGGRALEGAYQLQVTATGADGSPLEATVLARGRVDAVAFENGVPAIEIAGQTYAIDLVSRIDAQF